MKYGDLDLKKYVIFCLFIVLQFKNVNEKDGEVVVKNIQDIPASC